MNLLIFAPQECDRDGLLTLEGRRLRHLNQTLRLQAGDELRVGELGGALGRAEVLAIDSRAARLRVQLDRAAPTPLPLTIVLALPRPKMLRRILRTLAETGVKDIHLINSYRVEKSYWQSPLLQPDALREALLSGLEQGMDTILPTVQLQRRFRPFAEDQLPALCAGRAALLADPQAGEDYPPTPEHPALLTIGPEGGFIPFERELIGAAGARPVRLGDRVLRVETALHCALGRHLA
jgi:16S rRNA (uracil1498-N3)-methyltransferase